MDPTREDRSEPITLPSRRIPKLSEVANEPAPTVPLPSEPGEEVKTQLVRKPGAAPTPTEPEPPATESLANQLETSAATPEQTIPVRKGDASRSLGRKPAQPPENEQGPLTLPVRRNTTTLALGDVPTAAPAPAPRPGEEVPPEAVTQPARRTGFTQPLNQRPGPVNPPVADRAEQAPADPGVTEIPPWAQTQPTHPGNRGDDSSLYPRTDPILPSADQPSWYDQAKLHAAQARAEAKAREPRSVEKRPSWFDLAQQPTFSPLEEEDDFVPPAPPATPRPEALCPKCQGKLVNPESLGWCPNCGYCRSLEETRTGMFDATSMSNWNRVFSWRILVEWACMLWTIPAAMLLGAAVCFFAPLSLPPEPDQATLATYTTILIGSGVVIVLLAQLWILLLIAPHHEGVGAKDMILPFRLWYLALRELRQTRVPISVVTFGVTLIVGGVLELADMAFWRTGFQKPARPEAAKGGGAPERGKRVADKSLRDAARDLDKKGFQKEAARDAQRPLEKIRPDQKRESAQCVILGYIGTPAPEGREEISALALGTMQGTRLVYAGLCRHGVQDDQELRQRLVPLDPETAAPVSGLPNKVTWVKPTVFCEVEHAGRDELGRLKEIHYKGLLLAP